VIVSREFAALDGVATIDTASTPIYDGADLLGVLIRVYSGRSQTARMVQRANPPLTADDFLGASQRHQSAVGLAFQAVERGPVLITGAPGTGKRRLAIELHRSRDGGELHVRDAAQSGIEGFASWMADIRTIFTINAGTLVICHIDALSPAAAHVLRQAVDLATGQRWRVIMTGATDIDMPELTAVAEEVRVPTLDARAEDLEPLIRHFARPSRVAPDAMQLLSRITWQGNIRQVETVMRSLAAHADHGEITASSLPTEVHELALRRALTRIERVEIREMLEALRESGGNRQNAADSLGVSRSTLYRRLRDAGIDLDNTVF